MLFNSFSFAIFLPIVFIIYWIIPKKFQWIVLLISSYYFYMSWNVKYVFLILFTTIVSYMTAILVEKEKKALQRKIYVIVALIVSLGILVFFKYFNFISTSMADILGVFSIQYSPFLVNVLLPVGISFYTFQTLSYVIDVYRGEVAAEHHFGKYAAFISFFPQLVAGPIERTRNLLPQIKRENFFDYEQATYGMKLMAWGFLKKIVIADTLAVYVDRIYNNIYAYHGMVLVMATLFFTIQIYCDFSGYSDIAVGCSKLFGIELMENFKSPYFSASVKEFWSRWHISLSSWFRDYVYIPMGGNRVSKWKNRFNLIVTFLVSGLWHGANWTYVMWGGIHGVAQVLEKSIMHKGNKNNSYLKPLRILGVFLFAAFAWIFFRAQSISEALYVIRYACSGIMNPISYLSEGYHNLEITKNAFLTCISMIVLLAVYDVLSLKYDVISCISKWKIGFRWMLYLIVILLILFCAPIGNNSSFIYFQF